MFTGIVQECVTVSAVETGSVVRVMFTKPTWGELTIGESILLHGICSTVVAIQADQFAVEYMPETLAKTNVLDWQVGDRIHAEPSATLQTKLSGNLVYGHVDTVAAVVGVVAESGQVRFTIRIPSQYSEFVVLKGALTINGVNLTIVEVESNSVTVDLIPHTASVTTLAKQKVGDSVNIELDYITKVIVQTTQRRLGS